MSIERDLIESITNGNFNYFHEEMKMYASSNRHNFGDLTAMANNYLTRSELEVFHRHVFLTLVKEVTL